VIPARDGVITLRSADGASIELPAAGVSLQLEPLPSASGHRIVLSPLTATFKIRRIVWYDVAAKGQARARRRKLRRQIRRRKTGRR